jgi:hypothetical protein
MTANQIRNELTNTAGVSPSWHFLQDCCAALGSNASADLVLQQILHHDLRDVVRVLEAPEGSDNANHTALASVQLRQAISDSRSASFQYKTTLPDSMRLLLQMEELLDLTQGIEARHATNNNAPSQAARDTRCFKLLLSDGYYADGRPWDESQPAITADQENRLDPSSSQDDFIVAMEISPVHQLSVNSLAGVKILLKGPIVVRHGILQLHNGNCIVLGGSVAHLVEIQKQARQQAQRLAGVDPTIRALIGPEGLMESQDGKSHR